MSDDEETLISEKDANKNCNKFKDLLKKYGCNWKCVLTVENPILKLGMNGDEFYMIINFLIPAYNKTKGEFLETWFEEKDGTLICPMNESQCARRYHEKDDGLAYILGMVKVFEFPFAVQRYRDSKEFNLKKRKERENDEIEKETQKVKN